MTTLFFTVSTVKCLLIFIHTHVDVPVIPTPATQICCPEPNENVPSYKIQLCPVLESVPIFMGQTVFFLKVPFIKHLFPARHYGLQMLFTVHNIVGGGRHPHFRDEEIETQRG